MYLVFSEQLYSAKAEEFRSIALSFVSALTRARKITKHQKCNMAEKRAHDGDSAKAVKRQKKGFQIGPANLPDGTHRRKGMHITHHTLLRFMLTAMQ